MAKTTESRERAGQGEHGGVSDVTRTTCAVVGGGPGGAVLALLLARKGVDVTLLEAHPDFDREFRGDTLHPSVMEIMDQLGLADRLLELRHSKVDRFTIQTVNNTATAPHAQPPSVTETTNPMLTAS